VGELFTAAARGDAATVERLLAAGAAPDAKSHEGYTPLIVAAARGHLEVVELLLAAGADVNLLDSAVGSSALHRAAQSDDPAVAGALLAAGAFLDLQSPLNGHTPLIDAVWHKRSALVEALLTAGARLDLRGRMGYTALDVARRDGLDEIIALIEAREAELERKRGAQRLMTAVEAHDPDDVAAALAEGVDLNALSPDGFTPLMVAAQNGDAAIVELLVAAGASARVLDPLMRATPAHKAGYRGHPAALGALLGGDVELDAQGPYNGYTALHDAVWHGHADCARILIEAGARIDVEGLDGRTPLRMAEEYNYDEIAELLRRAAEGVTEESRV
jgi:ankyrin repeat protein